MSTTGLSSAEAHVWRTVIAAGTLLERELDRMLRRDADLTHAQFTVLRALSGADGHALRMTDLADQLLASKSGTTYQVAQLERAGLVDRSRCVIDERGVFAVLTEAGRGRASRAAGIYEAGVRALLLDVTGADQLGDVADLLDGVCRRILAAPPELHVAPA